MPAILVIALATVTSSGCGGGSSTIGVAVTGGAVTIEQSEVDSSHLVFEVTNEAPEAQTIVIVELTDRDGSGATMSPFAPGRLPVVDGQIRHYSYIDEPGIVIWTWGGGGSAMIGRGVDPPPRPPDLGVTVQPSETVKIEPRYDAFPAGTVLVLLNDAPGAYEAGAWASLTVR